MKKKVCCLLQVLVLSNKIKSNKHFVVHLNPFPVNGFPHFKAYNEFAVLIILLEIKKKPNYRVLRKLLSFIIHDDEKEADYNSVDLN